MEVTVTTDVTEANEPLLKVLRSGGEKWINKYITYPSDGDADNLALINEMCIAARELSEKELNRALAEKTLTVFWELDEVKRQDFRVSIPYGPISAIDSVYIVYADGTADLELTANSDYYLFGNQYKDIWMAEVTGTAGTGEIAGYKVSYVCGYDSSGCEAIPKALKVIMASQVWQWYDKRADNLVLSAGTKKALQQFTRKSWI
jgi:uncharacterized phiE125 gp8 family phage protein